MSTYKPRRSPFYHYDFRYKRHRFTGSTEITTKREAEKWVRDFIKPAKRAEVDQAERLTQPGRMTWGQARDQYWIEVGQHHAGEGAANTRRALDWLDQAIGRATPLRNIGSAKVAEIVARRRGEGVANGLSIDPRRSRCGRSYGVQQTSGNSLLLTSDGVIISCRNGRNVHANSAWMRNDDSSRTSGLIICRYSCFL
jgi:hypothetical protein